MSTTAPRAPETTEIDVIQPRRRLPAVPDVFHDGQADVPSSAPLRAVIAAYQGGEQRWQAQAGRAYPYFTFDQPQSSTVVSLRPQGADPYDERLSDSLWVVVRQLGDLDVDVLLAALAQWMDPGNRDTDDMCWISASAILDYRGLQPRHDATRGTRYRAGHRTEDIRAVSDCWSRFDMVWVEIMRVQLREEDSRRKGRHAVVTRALESRLLTVTDRVTQSRLGTSDVSVAWRYRPGSCFDPFLRRPNLQTAKLMRRALQYDWYHQQFPKRLARYLLFHGRISRDSTQRSGRPLQRRIRDIFEETGLFIDRRNPERTKRKFEAGLDVLGADGIIAGWSYASDRPMPAKGWLETWLGSVVALRLPAATEVEAPNSSSPILLPLRTD